MKALMKTEKGYDKMLLAEFPEPVAEKDLVKIKVIYSGVCGTDLHAFKGEYAGTVPPVILGHEFSGIVTDVGPDVTQVKIGDRVTSETTYKTCNVCKYCIEKDYNLCSERQGLGTQINGSFAEYVVSREESVHVLPNNVSLISAALTEPLACVVHAALEKAVVNSSDVVVVFGPGAIGLLTCMTLKGLNATVVLAGTTKDKERFEIAEKIGVDRIVNQQEEDLLDVIMKMTDKRGADKVFECSGAVPALNKAFEIAGKKGEIIQLGIFAKELNNINLSYMFPKELVYKGTRSQKPSSWHKALKLMEEEKVKPEQIVTLITGLDNWREAIEKSINCEEVKVVLRCAEDSEQYF